MTGQERILAAINHQEPDRVPIDLGATPSSGISALSYHALNKHLDFKDSKTRIYDTVQELALLEDHIEELFGVDVLDLGSAVVKDPTYWTPFQLNEEVQAYYPTWFKPIKGEDNSWQVFKDDRLIAKKPVGATFFDGTYFPYQNGYPENYENLDTEMARILWAAMPTPPWHAVNDPNFWQNLRAAAIELRRTTQKALIIGVGCNLFEWGTFLRRMDNFLMDVYADPIQVEKLLDALMERHLSSLALVCEHLGDVVDIVKFGDDLGMDNGPFMAPEIYRAIFKEKHKTLCDFVQKNSQMVPMLHSCGSIYQLIPDLIDAGFKILNPVQTNAYQMDPAILKKEFGKDLCFWGGGVDTRTILNHGTPQQVRDQVKERIEIFSPGGGFVFNTVHNILPDVPSENIVAMFDEVLKYR